jgi:hypothetical protein
LATGVAVVFIAVTVLWMDYREKTEANKRNIDQFQVHFINA